MSLTFPNLYNTSFDIFGFSHFLWTGIHQLVKCHVKSIPFASFKLDPWSFYWRQAFLISFLYTFHSYSPPVMSFLYQTVFAHVKPTICIHTSHCPWHLLAVFKVQSDFFFLCYYRSMNYLRHDNFVYWQDGIFHTVLIFFLNNLCLPFRPSLNVGLMFSEDYPQWDLHPSQW